MKKLLKITIGVSPMFALIGPAHADMMDGPPSSVSSLLKRSTNASTPIVPQGRLTLTSGTAIPTSGVAGATTLYYTPAPGRFVPIYNGSVFVNTDIGGELSQATTDTTKSPAAVTTSQVYDVFVWNDAGTIRATRGPTWASGSGSNTARGTGAGSTALTLLNGILVNANNITNGPVANFGTYVGTVVSDSSSHFNMVFGGGSAGGTLATLGVWNAYNRVTFNAKVSDTTGSWTYTSITPRAADASNNNRINFVSGLQADAFSVAYESPIDTAAITNASCKIGFALNTTNTFDRLTGLFTPLNAVNAGWPQISGTYAPQLGSNFIQATESGNGSNMCTFNVDTPSQSQQLEIQIPM